VVPLELHRCTHGCARQLLRRIGYCCFYDDQRCYEPMIERWNETVNNGTVITARHCRAGVRPDEFATHICWRRWRKRCMCNCNKPHEFSDRQHGKHRCSSRYISKSILIKEAVINAWACLQPVMILRWGSFVNKHYIKCPSLLRLPIAYSVELNSNIKRFSKFVHH